MSSLSQIIISTSLERDTRTGATCSSIKRADQYVKERADHIFQPLFHRCQIYASSPIISSSDPHDYTDRTHPKPVAPNPQLTIQQRNNSPKSKAPSSRTERRRSRRLLTGSCNVIPSYTLISRRFRLRREVLSRIRESRDVVGRIR